jgi:hypothetical protein
MSRLLLGPRDGLRTRTRIPSLRDRRSPRGEVTSQLFPGVSLRGRNHKKMPYEIPSRASRVGMKLRSGDASRDVLRR